MVTRPPHMPTSLSLRTVEYPAILGSLSKDRSFDSWIMMISISIRRTFSSSSTIFVLIPFAFHCKMLRQDRNFTSAIRTAPVVLDGSLVIPGLWRFTEQFSHLQEPAKMYISCSVLERLEQLLWHSRRHPAQMSGRNEGRVERSHTRQERFGTPCRLAVGDALTILPTRITAFWAVRLLGRLIG